MARRPVPPPDGKEPGHHPGLLLIIGVGKPKRKGVKGEGTKSRRRLDRGGRAHAANHGHHAAMSRGHLTTEARADLPKSDFALPGKISTGARGGKHTHGAYPIPDESHARNALARVAQHGTPAEQAQVRRKVHAKFPGIDIGGKD